MTDSVGSVSVSVVPSAESFWTQFKAQTRPGARDAGTDLGNAVGTSMGTRIATILRETIANLPVRGPAADQGKKAGDAFSRTMAERITAATKALGPRVKIDADTAPAVAEMENLRRRIRQTEAHLRIGRIDDETAITEIRHLQAELANLSQTTPDIHVRVNSGAAAAELAALQAQLGLLGDTTIKSRGQFRALRDSITLLGPAIFPILASLGALAVGVGAAGAAGVLAILGVKRAMENGSAAGADFGGILNGLRDNLHTLEAAAASGVLEPFRESAWKLHALTPRLAVEIGVLSHQVGSIAEHSISGLVGGFHAFAPAAQHVLVYVDQLASRFESWANGPGGEHFAATLVTQFDRSMPSIENLIGLVGTLVEAFMPVGGVVLQILGAVSGAINAIPTPALQTLVTVLYSLFIANRVALAFSLLSGKLALTGAAAAGASTRMVALRNSMSGIVGKAGMWAALAVGIYTGMRAISNMTEGNKAGVAVLHNLGKAQAAFGAALAESRGQIDANVRSTVAAQIASAKLDEKAGKVGITVEDMTTAVTGNAEQFRNLVAQWKSAGKPSESTIAALGLLKAQFEANREAAQRYASQTAEVNKAQLAAIADYAVTKSSLVQVAAAYGLTAEQVTTFAATLGITSEEIKGGEVTVGELTSAIQSAGDAYMSATQSGSAFLASLQQFATSSGTAADKAALIGAYLKASQGDALTFASAMSGVSAAQQSLIKAFDGTARAAINLNKGTIDYAKAGAPALISQLQSLQDAAAKAAEATFQHELATKGSKRAGEDATTVFENMTRGTLVRNATQLGLTRDQAKKLANQYFAMPPDVKTTVKAIGMSDINRTLEKIGEQLSYLTGRPFTMAVKANTSQARTSLDILRDRINRLQDKTINITVATNNINKRAGMAQADGGVVKYFADGGLNRAANVRHFAEGAHVAQIAPAGAFRVWAEEETGGEAYIPLAQSKRARSVDILEEVARRFGLAVVQRAGTAQSTPSTPSTARGSSGGPLTAQIHMRVEVAPDRTTFHEFTTDVVLDELDQRAAFDRMGPR